MCSESEVHVRTVLDRAHVSARAVSKTVSLIATIFATAFLQLAPAYGQAMRTYVSGTGKDGNPCTVVNPCRTLQAALGLTRSGGEIQSLDSADYGYVTITQGITITGAHGATGVLAANLSGITINAGPNDIVTLRGLEIDGAGSGTNGIQFNSGAALNVQDSVIRGFGTGISFQPKAASSFSVSDTVLSNNTTGIQFQTSAPSTGVLSDTHLVNNASGAVVQGASSASVASLTVQNGVVANNATVGILSNGFSIISIYDTTIANNGIGLEAQNAGAVLQLSGSSLTGNTTGWAALNGGQVISSASNAIGGNINGNSAPPTSLAPPTPPPVVSHLTDGAGNYFSDLGGGYVTAL
jgi:Right handed beta helix region